MKNNKNEFVKPGGFDLKDRLVSIQRVTKVTKGGRAFGFTAIVVVGDENGVVGHGLGKSKDVATSIAKAVEDAKKNLVRIALHNSTLPHEQKGKHGGAKVFIKPASQGTGVIAGGAVRACRSGFLLSENSTIVGTWRNHPPTHPGSRPPHKN